MLCDAGANTECTAEMLLQFAFLASLYAEKINGVVKPRVGLVNNGTEDTKGDPLRKEAYALLKKAGDEGRLNFVGNVEGSMVPLGACDVAVCDGFNGNVQLKTIEGVAKFMSKEIKGVFMASSAPSSATCCARKAWMTPARCSIRTRSAARRSSVSQSRSSRRTARPTKLR